MLLQQYLSNSENNTIMIREMVIIIITNIIMIGVCRFIQNIKQ